MASRWNRFSVQQDQEQESTVNQYLVIINIILLMFINAKQYSTNMPNAISPVKLYEFYYSIVPVLDPSRKMASRRNRFSVQQDQEQESTEIHHGKTLSSPTNYSIDININT
jgi:hypothetical protein